MTTNNNLTFVTAFISVPDKRYDHNRVSFDRRVQYFMKMVELDINICLFISPDIKELMENLTSKYKNVTICEVLDINDLEITKITNHYKEHNNCLKEIETKNKNTKDVPDYMLIQNSKIEFVKKSIDLNPYNSNYFCWIDFSILYVCHNIENSLSKIKEYSKTRFISTPFIAIPGWCNIKIQDTDLCNSDVYWRFCGGFFIGDKQSLLSFYYNSINNFHHFLTKTETLVWEVHYWAWLEKMNYINPIWYKTNHDDSILNIPNEIKHI